MRKNRHVCGLVEGLECRRLLAGVTIITHGYNSSAAAGTWPDRMGEAIAERAGGAVSQYTLAVNGSSTAPTSHTFTLDSGSPPWDSTGDATNTSGELVIKLDWGPISARSGISTVEVADYTAAVLLSGVLPRSLLEVPIHLIGHSRGASLIVSLAKKLGEAGLWVDQLTGLDPHPVDGINEPPLLNFNYGDAPMELFSNVTYGESFYRPANGNLIDFGGEPIPGASNFGPLNLPGGSSLDHSDVHAYYHGTIDRDSTNNGDGGPIETTWYGTTAGRATAGFDAARLGRGPRGNAGIGSNFGGGGVRSAVAISGAQWFSNVGFVDLTDADGLLSPGEATSIAYRYQETHAQPANIQFYLDYNTNPYDGSGVLLGQQAGAPTGGANTQANFAFNFPMLGDGVYRAGAKITNPDGRVRYAYNNSPLTVVGGRATVGSKQFTGEIAGSTSWAEPRNWSPGGVPTSGDRVLLRGQVIAQTASLVQPAAVSIVEGALFQLTGTNTVLLRTGDLAVSGQGRLDIGSGAAIVDYASTSPINAIAQSIATAYAGGAWNGAGITSSAIAGAPDTAVGFAEASQLFSTFPATFMGQSVDSTAILIRHTLSGDANLDRAVNLDDFTLLAANFGLTGRVFGQGDFNYDASVNLDDFTSLASQFGKSLPGPADLPRSAGSGHNSLIIMRREGLIGQLATNATWDDLGEIFSSREVV